MGESKTPGGNRLQKELGTIGTLVGWAYVGDGLAVVLVRRRQPVFENKPFVTWLFGVNGLFSGYYDLDETRGFESFIKRVQDELGLS
jgi:hypothetical protein